MSLPNDVARCAGVFSIEDGSAYFREGCETCQRRTDKGTGDHVVNMDPPNILVFECPFLIEPESRNA